MMSRYRLSIRPFPTCLNSNSNSGRERRLDESEDEGEGEGEEKRKWVYGNIISKGECYSLNQSTVKYKS